MALRGTVSKEIVYKKLSEMFPDTFMDGKIMRIPMIEDGEVVEIKVQLTAAKDVLGGGSSVAEPSFTAPEPKIKQVAAPTEDEIKTISNLMKELNS